MSAVKSSPEGDVNDVVAYNVGRVRDLWGWTPEQLGRRLAQLSGRELSDAAAATIAGAFAAGARRFDAHELYLLSVVFEVPIAYFFVPPPQGAGPACLADTGRPVVDLYGALLGRPRPLQVLDDRLGEVDVVAPEATASLLAALFGMSGGARTWPEHYRLWRQDRLRQLSRDYADPLRQLSGFLGALARDLGDAGMEASLGHLEAGS